MLHRTERKLENIPVGPLGFIPITGCEELGQQVDSYIAQWRKEKVEAEGVDYKDYLKESYIVDAKVPRFGSGEAKAIINESVRGKDLFIMVDVCNYSLTYSLSGKTNRMSPDDHFQNLKRVIAAVSGKARRINVIMPFLYESRQHKRSSRESLDCALALQELVRMGVENIITFDAHDPGIQNSIPNNSFENFYPTNSILEEFIETENIDFRHMLMISPDTGAVDRARLYADFFHANVGIFYKRRDRTKIVDGKNPVVEHKYIGDDVKGKNVIVVDDMIASGGSMLEVAKELKERGANKIYLTVTFSLFTEGTASFDDAYQKGYFDKIYSTNLTYIPKEILEKEWFHQVDCSHQIAEIIDTLNRGETISHLLNGRKELVKRIEKKMNYKA